MRGLTPRVLTNVPSNALCCACFRSAVVSRAGADTQNARRAVVRGLPVLPQGRAQQASARVGRQPLDRPLSALLVVVVRSHPSCAPPVSPCVVPPCTHCLDTRLVCQKQPQLDLCRGVSSESVNLPSPSPSRRGSSRRPHSAPLARPLPLPGARTHARCPSAVSTVRLPRSNALSRSMSRADLPPRLFRPRSASHSLARRGAPPAYMCSIASQLTIVPLAARSRPRVPAVGAHGHAPGHRRQPLPAQALERARPAREMRHVHARHRRRAAHPHGRGACTFRSLTVARYDDGRQRYLVGP